MKSSFGPADLSSPHLDSRLRQQSWTHKWLLQQGRTTPLVLRGTRGSAESADTALAFIDPQNDALSSTRKAYAAIQESLQANHTVENMERLFKAAKMRQFEVSFLRITSFQRTMVGSSMARWRRTS